MNKSEGKRKLIKKKGNQSKATNKMSKNKT